MAKRIKSYPVPPTAVYMWRGFMAPPPYTYQQFISFLGSVFVPACALLQPPIGLRAYITTFVPQKNKPANVPDQTALMFWATPQSHDLAKSTLAERMYENLHGATYDMKRSSTPENPIALPADRKSFSVEQPYYLYANDADWMLGKSHHVVGARPNHISPDDFQSSIFQWCSTFKDKAPAGIDAALVCCGNDYAVAWVHATIPVRNFGSVLKDFASLVNVQLSIAPRSINLTAGLWNKWGGLDLTQLKNTSLNIQLNRPVKTDPVK